MATIDSLPPELLSEVLSYLDTPPPSGTRLHEQPDPDLLTSPEKSLKNASLVCRKWHATSLRFLFRHVIWGVDRWELLRVDPSQNPNNDPIDSLPLLSFLRDQDLARYVDSFTMIVRDSLQGTMVGGSRQDSILRAGAGGSIGGRASGSTGPSPLVHHYGSPMATTYNQDSNWVWDMLFQLMNPTKFTILASPQLLATLLSTRIYLQDAWSFSRTNTHILSLSRETKTKDGNRPKEAESSSPQTTVTAPTEAPNELLAEMMGGVSSEVLQRPPTKLFTIRPWTHLLLNEGSSTRVYKTYEFYHRRPPSILGALLGADRRNAPLVPDTVRSLAYVAIFPLSSHFHTLVNHLPLLDRLFVQIVPRDDTLSNPEEMRHVQPSDLWMERNSCYSLVLREILSGEVSGHDSDTDTDMSESEAGNESNWRHLKEFESGDAADKEAWDMAVQFVCMSGTDWQVEREGVFVKRPPGERRERINSSPSPDSDQDGAPSPVRIRGNLQRLSFNGTAPLPFSPMSANLENYVIAWPSIWETLDGDGVESAGMPVDFFNLLPDVTVDMFGPPSFGAQFPATIGDLAETGYFSVWNDGDEGEEGEQDEDYHDESRHDDVEVDEEEYGNEDDDAGAEMHDLGLDGMEWRFDVPGEEDQDEDDPPDMYWRAWYANGMEFL